MSAIVIEDSVRIPAWVVDLDSFRRWAKSDEFPEHGWFSHLNGELWIDLSMERLIHNQIKGEIAIVVGGLVRRVKAGRYIHDRMLLTNLDANLSTEPDGMFVSSVSIEQSLVRFLEGGDSLEVEGTPDMTLEVVSPKSVRKDTVVLRDLYWQAGVREYWLIDPRDGQVLFQILQHTARGYVAAKKQAGWIKSAVFGKAFRLTPATDAHGLPVYSLEMR